MNRTADLGVTAPSRAVNQDNVDVEPTTHLRMETATREPTEAQSSENSSDAAAQAITPVQPQTQPRYLTRERKAPQRLGFDT